ncbi:hypothetical protein B5M42_021280 [Paenibacillus athensensis]|uniref:Uncharacterized protein n=1 Tax=Paenibacillus athensensis TaxID=1967502 RepID=A0A4Y8Q0Y5_9BACL|nr:hypothetical protein [Paenibacillus athensensis]MCD1261337.1 hypothetical protein [Paenibacillus athensensis]
MKLEWLSLLLGVVTVLFLAAVVAFQWLSRHGADSIAFRQYEALRKPGQAQKKQALYSFMQQLYVVCQRVPLLRAYLLHIRKRMTILQLGDEWKLRLETMKTALFIWSVLLAAAVPLAIGMRDPASLGMIGIGFWVGHGILSDHFVHRLDMRLLRQLRLFLSDVRHHYHRHGMVEEAIYEAADSAPYEMALHGQELYDVLTASDAEQRLAEYIEGAPNRYLQGMAGLSHLVKEYGDKRTATGSMYLKALGKLATELNLELLRRERLGFLLQGLTVIALLPLLFTRPIEGWASRYFPAMDAFYASTTGWCVKLGLMAVVWLSYALLRNIQELDAGLKPTSRTRWEKRMYEWAWMRWLAFRLGPAPGSREAERVVKLLKESASPLRLEWLVVQRIVAGGLAFAAAIGMFVALHAASRHQILYAPVKPTTLFGQLSPSEEAKALEAAALDRRVIHAVKGVSAQTEETMIALLRRELPASTQAELRMTARRILSKLSMLDGEYVKWWEVLLALLAGWGGYALPVGIRRFQRRMRQMEMKHEVDQLHAIIAMLADMDRMSVEQLLIWMEQFARVFKEPLQTCLLHFEHGAQQALAQLKEDAPFLPFVRTVEKLEQAVQSLPIREVFDDLESEQAYAQEQRKQEYEQLIEQKAGWGKWIGFAPMMALIFGYLVIPLVLASLNQMSAYYEQLQRIQ